MEIPRSLLDELSEEVNALSQAAQAQASIALGNLLAEWDGQDFDALLTAAIAVLESILGAYTDLSAARAAESYDAMRAAQAVGGTYAAVADSRRNPGATQGALYAITKAFEDSKSEARFRADVVDRVDTEMRRAANQCIAHNAARDPKKPRYARVPVGETCGFCLMLASFGYQYTSEEAASHSHRKCNCRVVPSFGDAEVSGYDPDEMYGRYSDCLSALGGRSGIREEWNALPKEERDRYIESHGGKAGSAFDAYVNKRVSQEIESRDPEWFATGKEPEPKYTKPRSALEPHERKGVDWLKGNGFALETVREDPRAAANLDLKMNGRLWEMKNVTNAESSVKTQIARARNKWLKRGNPGEAHIVLTMDGCADPIEDVAKTASSMGSYKQVLIVGDAGVLRIRK